MPTKMALSWSTSSMTLRTCSQCVRHPQHGLPLSRYQSQRLLRTGPPLRSAGVKNNNNPLRTARSNATNQAREQEISRYRRSIAVSAAGIVVCAVGMYGVIKTDVFGVPQAATTTTTTTVDKSKREDAGSDKSSINGNTTAAVRLDGPGSSSNFVSGDGGTSSSVIRLQGQQGDPHQVPTGNSAAPFFPTTIKLPGALSSQSSSGLKSGEEVANDDEQEYNLLGLGIRTVSFLRIQVYVVGLYVAKSDMPELQKLLVRTAIRPPGQEKTKTNSFIADAATSLVPGERQQLKELLLDAEQSNEAWNAILKKTEDEGVRTALRIVPTRNTDFMHLRDGWVRGITARATAAAQKAQNPEFQDESFGTALNDFKSMFGGGLRKSVPKGQALVLHRNAHGVFDALYEPDAARPLRWLGRVHDERISRLVWLHYLGGKNVASEPARQSVVEGVMGVVERPVGTV